MFIMEAFIDLVHGVPLTSVSAFDCRLAIAVEAGVSFI